MIKIVPNALGFTRIFCAVLIVTWGWHAMSAMNFGVVINLFVIGWFTDVLDGAVARRLDVQTPFGEKLDPIADAVLTVAAVAMLVRGGFWPIWLVILLALTAIGLQLIHQFREVPGVRPLKRFQNLAHPIFSVAVTYSAFATYVFYDREVKADLSVLSGTTAGTGWDVFLMIAVTFLLVFAGIMSLRRLTAHPQQVA